MIIQDSTSSLHRDRIMAFTPFIAKVFHLTTSAAAKQTPDENILKAAFDSEDEIEPSYQNGYGTPPCRPGPSISQANVTVGNREIVCLDDDSRGKGKKTAEMGRKHEFARIRGLPSLALPFQQRQEGQPAEWVRETQDQRRKVNSSLDEPSRNCLQDYPHPLVPLQALPCATSAARHPVLPSLQPDPIIVPEKAFIKPRNPKPTAHGERYQIRLHPKSKGREVKNDLVLTVSPISKLKHPNCQKGKIR